jgi:hypothetical protein
VVALNAAGREAKRREIEGAHGEGKKVTAGRNACASLPEAGARCVSSACRGLGGGAE